MGLERCRVVLVETHYPGNLGAVARIMGNLGLSDLVLVQPVTHPSDPRARQMATHGNPILAQARIVARFEDAVADCALVLGTSARGTGLFRQQVVGPPHTQLPALANVLRGDARAALVFGSEPVGLDLPTISHCHGLIKIPTQDVFPALNLAQAVAICLYELSRTWNESTLPEPTPPADHAAHDYLFRHLQQALEAIHFLYGPKARVLMHAVRHLLFKARLTPQEVKILHGLARQILWFVGQVPRRDSSDE